MVVFFFVLKLAIGLCVAFLAGWTVGSKRQSSPGTSNGKLQATHGLLCFLTSEELKPVTTSFHSQSGKAPKPFNGDDDCSQNERFLLILRCTLRIYSQTETGRLCKFFLGGSAPLFFLASRRAAAEFADWSTQKTHPEETLEPLHTKEDSRLDLFSLTQTGSLDEYIREFSHLSLKITDVDDVSQALLFLCNLSDSFCMDTTREHPSNLSQAIRAAQATRRCVNISSHHWNAPLTAQKAS